MCGRMTFKITEQSNISIVTFESYNCGLTDEFAKHLLATAGAASQLVTALHLINGELQRGLVGDEIVDRSIQLTFFSS